MMKQLAGVPCTFATNVDLFYVESITGPVLFPGLLLVMGRYVTVRVRLLEHLHCSAQEC